jgi:hypothetical protein
MRDACCDGLRQRRTLGRGGTARSVPFATKVCAGGPVVDDELSEMLTHMTAIERAMETRLGDPVLEVAWRLWGGDAGREWAEGFIYRPQQVLAAAAGDDVEQPDWMTRLNALARDERALLARIHELCEAGMEVALSKVHAKVVNALTRPSGALRASLGGLDRRDEVLAEMRRHGNPSAALAAVPPALMAKLGPSAADSDLMAGLFQQHTLTRVDQLVLDHQRQVIDILRDASTDPAVLDQLGVVLADARGRAVNTLARRLLTLASDFIGDANPLDVGEGEVPIGRVPGSMAWDFLSDCGGGNPAQPGIQDWAQVGGESLLASGVAVGVLVLRAIDRLSVTGSLQAAATMQLVDGPELDVVTVTTWRWGGSQRPFPPHQALDGRTWVDDAERAQVVRNPERFPPGDGYYPGDHAGCSCSLEVELRIVQRRPGRAVVRRTGEPGEPGETAPVVAVHGDLVTEAKAAQVRAMAGRLAEVTQPGRSVHIAITNRLDSSGETVGAARRGGDEVYIAGEMLSDRKPQTGTNLVRNAAQVTDLEYTTIHEWAHTTDRNARRSDELFAELAAEQAARPRARIFPSEYAETNGSEMYAEAFTDWHINPKTAHPLSKRLAEEFGWQIDVPLSESSALRRRDG